MSTPGGFDPRYDPTAPTYEPPSYEPPSYEPPTYEPPTYDAPTYDASTYGAPTYGPPSFDKPSFDKPPADEPPVTDVPSAWPPPEPAEPQGSGWYLAPPSAGTLPPGPEQPGPTYPGYGPGPGPAPKSGRGAGLAIALGAIVLVVLAAVGLGFVFLRGDDDRQVAAPPPSTSASAPPTTSAAPSGSSSATTTPSGSSASPSGAAEVMVPAVTPGFQGVLSPKENVAYDVPEGWEVQTPGTLVGYEDANGNPVALIHGVSTFRPDACPDVQGSNRGNAGFKTAGTLDPAQAVQDGVQVFAQAAALNDDGSSAPVTPGTLTDVAVAGGAITAKMFTATVTPAAGADCGAPSIAFTGVAFSTPSGGTALFIMFLDQGTSDALSPELAQQIVASLRPYGG